MASILVFEHGRLGGGSRGGGVQVGAPHSRFITGIVALGAPTN